MAIHLKNAEQIEAMYRSGQLVRTVLDRLGEMICPGMTTEDLDAEALRLCNEHGATPLFKGVPNPYGGTPFPACICASINEEVVHGIPSADRLIADGDLVSVDFGILLNGWCGDSARTFEVGNVPEEHRRLNRATKRMLEIAVELAGPEKNWSDVVGPMQNYVHGEGFSIVEKYVGHGIGREMHELPQVPNYLAPELTRRDIRLKPGLVLAVEPMVNLGTYETVEDKTDLWTVRTADGKPSSHWEHMLAVTEQGVRVLTA